MINWSAELGFTANGRWEFQGYRVKVMGPYHRDRSKPRERMSLCTVIKAT